MLVVKPFFKKLALQIVSAGEREKHLVKCFLLNQNIKNNSLILKDLYSMINSRGNENYIPLREMFPSCTNVLGTCSMIYKYNFKKIMTMKKCGSVAVMSADIHISLFAFFKIFLIVHLVGNNLRKKRWAFGL